jgi:uncharacterized protein (TIGR03066 family)
MRLFSAAFAVLLALAFAAQAEDKKEEKKGKIDKAKLVGTWTFVKTDALDAPPKGSTLKVEFTKDGKMNVTLTFNDRDHKMSGTYKVDGDKLTTTLKGPKTKEKTETSTIKELTDKKLVLLDKKGDKTETTEFEK